MNYYIIKYIKILILSSFKFKTILNDFTLKYYKFNNTLFYEIYHNNYNILFE